MTLVASAAARLRRPPRAVPGGATRYDGAGGSMERKGARRHEVLDRVEHAGGLKPGVAEAVSRSTGVPAADVYGVATFYSLLARPDVPVRMCQGLSCKMAGSDEAAA